MHMAGPEQKHARLHAHWLNLPFSASLAMLDAMQSPVYGSTGPATSFSRDMGLWQGSYVAVAAQRSIEIRRLANLNSMSGMAKLAWLRSV